MVMLTPFLVLPLLLVPLLLLAVDPALAACSCVDSAGSPDVKTSLGDSKAVCGSDNITYVTECNLDCAKDSKQGLTLLHQGPCKFKVSAPFDLGPETRRSGSSRMTCAGAKADCNSICGSQGSSCFVDSFSCVPGGNAYCTCGCNSCSASDAMCREICRRKGGNVITAECLSGLCECTSAASPLHLSLPLAAVVTVFATLLK